MSYFHRIKYFILIIIIKQNLNLPNNLSNFKCNKFDHHRSSFNSQSCLRYLSRSKDSFSRVVSYAMDSSAMYICKSSINYMSWAVRDAVRHQPLHTLSQSFQPQHRCCNSINSVRYCGVVIHGFKPIFFLIFRLNKWVTCIFSVFLYLNCFLLSLTIYVHQLMKLTVQWIFWNQIPLHFWILQSRLTLTQALSAIRVAVLFQFRWKRWEW